MPGPAFYGMGMETIRWTLEGGEVIWYAFIMKAVFTSITLGFGGSGGILIPIFFVGATTGAVMAGAMGEGTAVFAAIGIVGLLSGAANAPIASTILAIELFGAPIGPYACLVAVISYLIAGHRSVFPSQILAIKKSSSVDIRTGVEMKNLKFRGGKSKTLEGFRAKLYALFNPGGKTGRKYYTVDKTRYSGREVNERSSSTTFKNLDKKPRK